MHNLQANVDEFPGRKAFPDIPVIELTQLRDTINDVVIVDARSRYEYETLHIKNAINLPVASKTFEQDLKNLVDKVKKPVVFYCNGRTCFKSYIAVKKGLKAGIRNLTAYDAGVFEWSENLFQKRV
jgi:rhodanese-related sulfurtransferase